MASTKEAVVLILDTSSSMSYSNESEKSPLENSISAINMICQRKMFSNSKDEVSLVLIGTNETSNQLNEENGGYEHISVARDLGLCDLDLLKLINDRISPGNCEADFIDGIVVGFDHLMRKVAGRKYGMRIVLFSDLSSPCEIDQLDTIIGSMEQQDVQFTFIGPQVGEEEDNDDDGNDDDDTENTSNQNPTSGGGPGPLQRKLLSEQQLIGIGCIKKMMKTLNGDGIPLSNALKMLSFFQTRSVKQTTTFRGPIEIGSSLKINVYGYVKIKESKPSSWSKLSALSEASANPGSLKVLPQRSYHLNDEDQTEVDKEDQAQAYRYGNTLVPISKMDQKSLKLETTKCLSVLGFTPAKNAKRHQFVGDSCYMFVPQPDDENAAVALSALVHALQEKDMVAIVRYCFRANASPKLGFLAPYIKNDYEGLSFIQLAFREDIRQYTFAPLDLKPKLQPTDEQLRTIDNFIDSMDLTTPAGDVLVTESKSTKILNPVIQRQCQCVQHRALHPEEYELPAVDEAVKRSVQVADPLPPEIQAMLSAVKENYTLTEIEQKKNKNVYNINKSIGNEAPSLKKARLDGDGNQANNDVLTLTDLTRQQITEVGAIDPLDDFEMLINRSSTTNTTELCGQLCNRIRKIINGSFLDELYTKALSIIISFKQHCIKLNQASVFNDLLNEFKTTMKDQQRDDFWRLLKSNSICPISAAECSSSVCTTEESTMFYRDHNNKDEDIQPEETQPIDDVDDLVAMM